MPLPVIHQRIPKQVLPHTLYHQALCLCGLRQAQLLASELVGHTVWYGPSDGRGPLKRGVELVHVGHRHRITVSAIQQYRSRSRNAELASIGMHKNRFGKLRGTQFHPAII